MGWGEYARSRIPLKLIFILIAAVAVNTMLIESIHLMLWFDPSDNLDNANFSSIDSRFDGCTVIDTFVDHDENDLPWENRYIFHLLETADGERFLAVVERHFLFSRARYREDLSMAVPSFASNQVPVFGADSDRMGYSCTLAQDRTIETAHVHGQTGLNIPIFLIPMLIAEYIAFVWLFRRDEIA